MFDITIRAKAAYDSFPVRVQVQGCPESGLASVDFLRAAGLPENADGMVSLPVIQRSEQEALCRQFASRLNGDADLRVAPPELESIPAPLAVEWLAIAKGAPLSAEFVGKVVALIDEDKAEEAKREAEREAKRQAAEAERKATEAAKVQAMRDWAAQHGSELLRARLAHEADRVEWVALAEQEYIDAAVAPLGAAIPCPYDREEITEREPRTTPTLEELARLDAARAALADRGEFSAVCEVSLWWHTTDAGDNFTSLCVDVTTPTGREVERWFAMK